MSQIVKQTIRVRSGNGRRTDAPTVPLLNRLLQEWGCSWRDRCQPGPSRQLLSTATWTLQSRLDMRSFSCLTIRARDGAPLFRVGEIFRCHSGGCPQSLVRDMAENSGEYAPVEGILGGTGGSAYLLVRLPMKLFLIAWIWWFALRTS